VLGAGALIGKATGSGLSDYSHVFRLIAAKLAHFGTLPADPNALDFEVRILWQGPFETASWNALRQNLNTPLLGGALLVALTLKSWIRGRGEGSAATLAIALLVTLVASWLIIRVMILAGFLLPVAAVVALRDVKSRSVLAGAAIGLVLPALWLFPDYLAFVRNADRTKAHPWYSPSQAQEIRAAIGEIERVVRDGEPIASDEITSTAILAHTNRPILVQPKYESKAARERLEEYRLIATRGTPQELAEWLRAHRCRYLLFDHATLWTNRYQAGVPLAQTGLEETAALAIIAREPERLPGFKLLWKSPFPSKRMRLYELLPPKE